MLTGFSNVFSPLYPMTNKKTQHNEDKEKLWVWSKVYIQFNSKLRHNLQQTCTHKVVWKSLRLISDTFDIFSKNELYF